MLRAPGLAALGDPVDENRGYKALGDEMAKHNGYFCQKSFELYDTTGTTEDWSYNATGGYGFTFEIYCGAPNYDDGRLRRPGLPPALPARGRGVGRHEPGGRPHRRPRPDQGFDGKGNREAYYIAAESAINEQRHSVLEGSARPARTLRLTKTFKTDDVPAGPARRHRSRSQFDDKLETAYNVGDDGKFRWHINPSTRPIVAKATGKEGAGPPSPAESRHRRPGRHRRRPGDDGAAPGPPTPTPNDPINYNDHPFTIPAGGDNESMSVRVEWATPATDYDVKLYEDTNGNGKSQDDEPVVGTSQNGATNVEEVSAARPACSPARSTCSA